MSPTESATLARLRAANPAAVDEDRAHSVIARAALQRILDEPAALADSPLDDRAARRRRGGSPRGLALVLAAVLVGGGAAFGATDPFGWWSATRSEAKYAANPASHVRTPSIEQISCTPGSPRDLRCAASRSGQYARLDAIHPSGSLSRTALAASIAKRVAAGKMNAADAARFRADLAAVPDSFFSKYQLASRFGTYSGGGDTGNGRTLVPPAGVPEFLVCEDAGRALSCHDLNGDHSASIGAEVYMAKPIPAWHPARPSRRPDFASPPGITFTRAERRLLIDMLKLGGRKQ